MSSDGLKRLKVRVEAKEFAVAIYRTILPCLPVEEKWCLASQIRRSAASIPANIAEGYGRFYYQANIQFCYNARGSLEETISHLILAKELGFISNEPCRLVMEKADTLAVLLNGYIAYLKKSKLGQNEVDDIGHSASERKGQYIIDETNDGDMSGLDNSPFSNLDSLN